MQRRIIGNARRRRSSRWLRPRRWHLLSLMGAALIGCGAPPTMLQSPETVQDGVVFRFRAPSALTVQLAGFWLGNSQLRGQDWSAGTRVGLMQLSEEDAGVWELKVPLTTGRYEYLFLVNGRFWELDPANPQRSPDGAGGQVSLLVVR